jgi:shikimate dehydrogenase
MNLINKDTKIYCSFSTNPGNNGCTYFNRKFQEQGINAIYKSFYSNNIEKSIEAVKTLCIAGFAVSMPFKKEVLKYVDTVDRYAVEIGAANTIINNQGHLTAYNTDWIGVVNYLDSSINHLDILGNGGFSQAVQYACKASNITYRVYTRNEWHEVSQLTGVVFNATPVDVEVKGTLIDGRPLSKAGKAIAAIQAQEQFKLYTNE